MYSKIEAVGKEKARKLALALIEIGKDYDCNNGEIFEAEDINDNGVCKKCRSQWN